MPSWRNIKVCLVLGINWFVGSQGESLFVNFRNKRWVYLRSSTGDHLGFIPCTILIYRLSPLAAQRIGDASLPGPFPVKFVVTNPTAILHKAEALHSLGADVYLLAETSATKKAQVSESFRRLGLRSLWGHPVPTQLLQHRDHDGYRGMAAGVSCHTCYPGQISRYEPPDAWETSGRFLQCF